MSQRMAGLRPRVACLALGAVVIGFHSASAQSGGAGSSKVPVTTASAEARQQYVKGRTLGENLRAHDSRAFLIRAAALDPKMALAHYSLALNAPTAKDFFDHMKQAAALADKASEGEQLMILGLQAGANADTKLQREYYEELAAAYPRDERAHFLLGGAYDGERRTALFGAAVIYADEGKLDQALAELKKEYAVAEKINDAANMSADLVAMGDVALEAGKVEEARKFYARSLQLQQSSDLSTEVKEDAKLNHHYNLGRAALKAADVAGAKEHARTFLSGASAKNNAGEIRLAHELLGAIALQEKQYDQALEELGQGNQQNPYTLYRTALAYQGKGDQAKAAEFFKQAADQHTLPTLNYAFVRGKAKKMKG